MFYKFCFCNVLLKKRQELRSRIENLELKFTFLISLLMSYEEFIALLNFCHLMFTIKNFTIANALVTLRNDLVTCLSASKVMIPKWHICVYNTKLILGTYAIYAGGQQPFQKTALSSNVLQSSFTVA